MIKPFDELSHPFTCENPQCRQVFQETYRGLLHADEVVCPTCGTAIDIRESKRAGEVGSWLNTIAEVAKQHGEKE